MKGWTIQRMLGYLLLGGGFAFAAAIQPGPLQVFLFPAPLSETGNERCLIDNPDDPITSADLKNIILLVSLKPQLPIKI